MQMGGHWCLVAQAQALLYVCWVLSTANEEEEEEEENQEAEEQ